MEIRMQPRTDNLQRCEDFSLSLKPAARFLEFTDFYGNIINHFDIPAKHTQLEIKTNSVVEVFPVKELPAELPLTIWEDLDRLAYHNDFWEFTLPSFFSKPTEKLVALAHELKLDRSKNALDVLNNINSNLHQKFEYDQNATDVDSPIDEAISKKSGVCQDFANIMIALARYCKIPCRYVSGYLFHRTDDRSHVAQDATHAWVEAFLPTLGWVGFDPTNNLIVGERHIRVAVGKDYADVPPTRGIYKGAADSELSVAVRVTTSTENEPDLTGETHHKSTKAKSANIENQTYYDQQ